jgi:hypothetical protein
MRCVFEGANVCPAIGSMATKMLRTSTQIRIAQLREGL